MRPDGSYAAALAGMVLLVTLSVGLLGRNRRDRRDGVGGGGEVGAGPALEVLGGRAGGVRGGEDRFAEGAPELHCLGEAGVGGVDKDGLKMGPVPGAFPPYGLCTHHDEALVPLVSGLCGKLVRRD